jgi:hypothetical protein
MELVEHDAIICVCVCVCGCVWVWEAYFIKIAQGEFHRIVRTLSIEDVT